MSIAWRPTLVAMQTALQGSGTAQLPPTIGQTGYSLLALLLSRGQAYDASADDGATNPSAFTATVAAYTAQAGPVFTELDRVARYIFSLYLTSPLMTPAIALNFGVVTQAQAASWQVYVNDAAAGITPPVTAIVPSITAATALAFDRTGGNFSTIAGRNYSAGLLCAGNLAQASILGAAYGAWFSGLWYDTNGSSYPNITPPTNPSAANEGTSYLLTLALNNTIAECQVWLAATAFS